MKVGTDGVLLGAWANCSNTKKILDIGTGSGLIALMLAQRSSAQIDAIDIDEDAYNQAKINFENSPFNERLSVKRISLQDYPATQKYDLLVSNPPYFSQSLKSPDIGRNFARHNDDLSLEELFSKSKSLLNDTGRLALIYPFDGFENLDSIAYKYNFYLIRKTTVLPTKGALPKRVLLEYSLGKETGCIANELYIEKARHQYSDEYLALIKEYYLNV